MLQCIAVNGFTHPPESCEVPRCRNDELKSYARKSLNHTHACKKKRRDYNLAYIITLWTTAEDTASEFACFGKKKTSILHDFGSHLGNLK